jgi:urease accessory protein
MQRVEKIISKEEWTGPAADIVVLSYHDRHRRRIRLTGLNGTDLLLDLKRATVLRDGDGLLLEDGRLVNIKAAAEPLLSITCDDPSHLARIAWHLGNRHLPAAISEDHILIREDHVIADMVFRLGAKVVQVEEPFNPEGGAYGDGGSGHMHDHDHDEGGYHYHG